jgi:DnaJ family protein C protein 13
MTCGQEHVEAEALRLLTRLWAPACVRSGQGPWELPNVGAGRAGAAEASDLQAQMAGYDLSAAGRQAKSLCLVPTGRLAAT